MIRGTGVRDALQGAATAFGAAGLDSPQLDAEVLLADVLGVGREKLHSDPDLTLAGPTARAYQDAVRRRAVEREPVAYITGRRHFRSLELRVDPRALIPRPESELLVELGAGAPTGARVLDLGTGSGAIALALKQERADLDVWGSDVSAPALELARENGAALALAVKWVQADRFTGLPDHFDVVLANPPYVSERERATLAPEITRHEPELALYAGADGLAAVRAIYGALASLERPRLCAVEVGAGQAGEASALARAAGFTRVRAVPDLASIERVVVAER